MVANKDKELIKDFLQGNNSAFEKLVSCYEKKVYSLCYHYVGNQEDALDMAQEAFVRVYQNLEKFRFDATFSTWIYRLTVNTCLDFIRKERKNNTVSLDKKIITAEGEITREIVDDRILPLEELEKKELREEVKEALRSLPQEQRTVIILKDFQELSYEEISSVLKIPIGTVRSRISRGRIKLKTIFEDKELLLGKVHLNRQGEVEQA